MSLCIGSFTLAGQHRVKMAFFSVVLQFVRYLFSNLIVSELFFDSGLWPQSRKQQLLVIVTWWGRKYFVGAFSWDMMQKRILGICSKDRCLCLLKVNLTKQRLFVKDYILNCVFPLEPLKQQFYFPIWSGTKPKQFTSSSSRVAKVFVQSFDYVSTDRSYWWRNFLFTLCRSSNCWCCHHLSSSYVQRLQTRTTNHLTTVWVFSYLSQTLNKGLTLFKLTVQFLFI